MSIVIRGGAFNELDQMVEEEDARRARYTQICSEGVLRTFGRGSCLENLQLPAPTELVLHSKGSLGG